MPTTPILPAELLERLAVKIPAPAGTTQETATPEMVLSAPECRTLGQVLGENVLEVPADYLPGFPGGTALDLVSFVYNNPKAGTTPTKAATPTSFAAGTPTATTVPLSWTGPTGATYVVQRSLTSDFNVTTPVYTGAATTTTATGLTASTGYYARVKAQQPGLTDSDWATLQLTTAAPAPQTDLSRFAFAGEGSNPENGSSFFQDLSGNNNHMPVVGMDLTRDGDKVQVLRADFGGSYNSGLAPTFSGTTKLSLYALIDLFEEGPFYLVTKPGFALGINDSEVGAWYTGAATGFFPCPIGRLRLLEFHLDSEAGTGEALLDGVALPNGTGTFTGNPFPAGCTIGFGGGGSRAFHGALHVLDIRTSGVDSEEQRQEMRAYLAAYHAQAPLVPDAVGAVPQLVCVGPSITQGYGTDGIPDSQGPFPDSPPALLQVAFGDEVDVVNKGRGGATMESYVINNFAEVAALYDGTGHAFNVVDTAMFTNDVRGTTPLADYIALRDVYFRRLDARGFYLTDSTGALTYDMTQPRYTNAVNLIVQYNTAHPLLLGLARPDLVPELNQPANRTYSFDGIHETAAGAALDARERYRVQAPVLRALGATITPYAPWS